MIARKDLAGFAHIFLAGVALAAAGCGGEKIVNITGSVTRAGKAIPDLGIHFSPEKGQGSHGLSDQTGHFTLMLSSGKPGALVGTHKVWVQLPAGDRITATKRARDQEMEAILLKYGNPETSPLTVEVIEDRDLILPLD
jgi:hypothetical protein